MTEYVLKALSSVSGMKALLMDSETAGMAALVLSQTDAIAREVFLTDRIDLRDDGAADAAPRMNARGELERAGAAASKESLHHLKAVVVIRPVLSSVQRLRSVMKSGRFKDYYVFFSNIAGDELLRALAEGDEHELVRQVVSAWLFRSTTRPAWFSSHACVCVGSHNSLWPSFRV
jgi:hypothetical protein